MGRNTNFQACQWCSGTGWALVEGKGVRPCGCRESEQLAQKLRAARIPQKYAGCTFETYQLRGTAASSTFLAQAYALREARHLADVYPQHSAGLLLSGPSGVGKTHLVVATLNRLIRQKGITGLFYKVGELLKEVQESYAPNARATEAKVLEPVYQAEVLVLDELGAVRPSSWALDTMTRIINARYNENRLTLFTTNYLEEPRRAGEETLIDRIGYRLRSRLYEMCKTVVIAGEDYRKTHKVESSQKARAQERSALMTGFQAFAGD